MANLAITLDSENTLRLSDDAVIRALLAQSIRRSGRSRDQIADELSRVLDREITVHMLNNYLAPGRESARMPAVFVRAFCEVTDDDTLQRFLLGPQLSKLLALGECVARALPALLDGACEHDIPLLVQNEERVALSR